MIPPASTSDSTTRRVEQARERSREIAWEMDKAKPAISGQPKIRERQYAVSSRQRAVKNRTEDGGLKIEDSNTKEEH